MYNPWNCPTDEMGNHPCDNGYLCDTCRMFDSDLNPEPIGFEVKDWVSFPAQTARVTSMEEALEVIRTWGYTFLDNEEEPAVDLLLAEEPVPLLNRGFQIHNMPDMKELWVC